MIGTVVLALITGWIAWRLSTGQPIIPGLSEAAEVCDCNGGSDGIYNFQLCPDTFCRDAATETCQMAAQRLGCYRSGEGEGGCIDYYRYYCPDKHTFGDGCQENSEGPFDDNPGFKPGCGIQQIDCITDSGSSREVESRDITDQCESGSSSSSSSSSSTSASSTSSTSSSSTSSSSSSGNPASAECISLDNTQGAGGARTFNVKQGKSKTIQLYTEVQAHNGGTVEHYIYRDRDARGTITPNGTSNSATASWTITAAQSAALDPGTYEVASVTVRDNNLDDTGGYGTNCAISVNILEDITPQAPEWTLTKTGAEVCATDGSSSTVTYTITLSNDGDTAGSVSEVVDTLDSDITASMIDDITPAEGAFDDPANTITWDGDGSGYTLDPGEQQLFTYTVTFDDSQFGTYANTVEATPSDGSTAPADASTTVNVNCEQDEELPETAIEPDQLLTIMTVLGAVTLLFLATVEVNYGMISRALKLNYVEGLSESDFVKRKNK